MIDSLKARRVSIVIPVYNEANHLRACLQAIQKQTVLPYEVIVVDNNSTDASAEIAASFPLVTLLNEPRQGVVHARNAGFDAASGDIIGRIDADTTIPQDWVSQISQVFTDPAIDAVSGSITYKDIPFPSLFARLELFFRQSIANRMGDEVFLYGANMAIKTSVWQIVRHHVCSQGGMHEDFDLAIHAEENGAKVVFDPALHAYVSLRRMDTDYLDFWQYVWLNPKTYAIHGRTSQKHMYTVIALVLLGYLPIKMLYKGYNEQTGKFSIIRALCMPMQKRVNPATFTD